MIRTVAIVPVRGQSSGKTRLAPVLGAPDRAALVESMAWHVVSTIQAAGVADLTVIVSRDESFRFSSHDAPAGIEYIVQPDHPRGLNAALDFGRQWALGNGADRLLVISADLPFLETADVHELVDRQAPVVIAPDRFAAGTNALVLGDPRRRLRDVAREFTFHFGDGSFRDHLAEAKRFSVTVDTASGPGTSFDLDTPEDWSRLPAHVRGWLLSGVLAMPGHVHPVTRTSLALHGAGSRSA